MKITKITPQISNPERVNIFVDDVFYAGIDAFHLYGLGLKKGEELSDEQLMLLNAVREQEKCTAKAMSLLSYRDRSSFELKRRLRQEGFSERAIEMTVETLLNTGCINDENFVRSYAESVNGRYPYNKILNKLWEWGIPRSFSEPLVQEFYDPEAEAAMAVDLAYKKLRVMKASSLYERRGKLYTYLRGKGFDGETISRAVSEVLE